MTALTPERPAPPGPDRRGELPHAQTWGFTGACIVAGGLAVPLHPLATPLSAALSGLAAFLGLQVWRWSRLPDLLPRERRPGALGRVGEPALWFVVGLAVGLLLLGIIRIVLEPVVPAIGARIAMAGTLPLWRRALIIYVAAVSEELVFRVLLLSAIAGLTVRIQRLPGRTPGSAAVWIASVLAALAFAAVHLPGRGHAGATAPGLILSVLALNAAGGIFLGHVFARRGLLAAILAHAGADCAIQLLGPLTG